MGRIDWISLAHRQAGLEATQKLQVADKLAYYGIQTACPQIDLWAYDSHKIGAPLKTKLLTTALNNAIID